MGSIKETFWKNIVERIKNKSSLDLLQKIAKKHISDGEIGVKEFLEKLTRLEDVSLED